MNIDFARRSVGNGRVGSIRKPPTAEGDSADLFVVTPRLMNESEFKALASAIAGAGFDGEVSGALFVVVRDGKKLYPSFLLDQMLKLRHLDAIVEILRGVDDLAKWLFFVSPKASLDGLTPLEALRRGKFRQVKAAAEGFAER